MKNIQTLKNKKEFDFVYKNSRKYRSQIYDICILESKATNKFFNKFKKMQKIHTIGLSVSKKIGKAVDRNLIKRRLKAICREILVDKSLNCKQMEYIFIVIAKNGIKTAQFSYLREQIYNNLLKMDNTNKLK